MPSPLDVYKEQLERIQLDDAYEAVVNAKIEDKSADDLNDQLRRNKLEHGATFVRDRATIEDEEEYGEVSRDLSRFQKTAIGSMAPSMNSLTVFKE
jgi:hypothetical protein